MKLFQRKKKNDFCYGDFWERMGSDEETALSMMDGSPSEEACQLTGQYIAKRISNALLLNPNDIVLELGCGVGRIGREIAPLCKNWFGADISKNLVGIAKKRMAHLTNVEFHLLQKSYLHPYPDHSFHKIYSHAVFIHLDKEDVFLYLREIARVLKPGGLLYFDLWNLKNEVGWDRWMMEVESWNQSDQKERKHVSRNQFFTPDEITLYVEKSGLDELFSFADSFWIQEIAFKSDQTHPEVRNATADAIHQRREKIAIPSELVDLFREHTRLIKGHLSPDAFYKCILNRGESEETNLYRPWFLALWKKNEKKWGPIPKI